MKIKVLLLFFFLSLSTLIFGASKQDSTLISNQFIIDLYKKVRILEVQDSIKTEKINEYEKQIFLYKELDKIRLEQQPKWYDNKYLWFVGGITTIYLSSEVVSNIK